MLRLVIPISHVDSGLAFKLLTHLSGEGDSAKDAPLTLILAKGIAEQSENFAEAAKKVSGNVEVFVCPDEDERGWPQSPNHLFQSAVRHLAGSGNTLPWLWLEPDTTLLTRDWLVQIETEYNIVGKPYMGTARPTILRDKEGTAHGTDGVHLIGVAVYPANFHLRSLLWKYLSDVPFDVFLRWEILPVAHLSKLFAHTWRATNFRGDRGKGLLWDGDDQTPVPATSVLHHGCKDGSLLRAIWGAACGQPTKAVKKNIPVIKLEVEDAEE